MRTVIAVLAASALTGCSGVTYHLPGHDFNAREFPDVTLKAGECTLAITQQFGVGSIAGGYFHYLFTPDPDILAVASDRRGRMDRTWLYPARAGEVTLHYGNRVGMAEPYAFVVTVEGEAASEPAGACAEPDEWREFEVYEPR